MKDLLILSIIMALIGGSFNSCEKNEDLCSRATDINRGIIVSDYDFGYCYSDIGQLNKQYVIRDQGAFEEMGFLRENSASCQDVALSAIDFDQNTLLGFYGEGTCNVYYTREITKNKVDKTYTYRLSISECGFCERLDFSMNWVLVPKVEADYTVNFVLG